MTDYYLDFNKETGTGYIRPVSDGIFEQEEKEREDFERWRNSDEYRKLTIPVIVSLIIALCLISSVGVIYGIIKGIYITPAFVILVSAMIIIVSIVQNIRAKKKKLDITFHGIVGRNFLKYSHCIFYSVILISWVLILFFSTSIQTEELLTQAITFGMYGMYLYPALMFINASQSNDGIYSIFGYIFTPLSIVSLLVFMAFLPNFEFSPLIVPTVSGFGYYLANIVHKIRVKKGSNITPKPFSIKIFLYILLIPLIAFALVCAFISTYLM